VAKSCASTNALLALSVNCILLDMIAVAVIYHKSVDAIPQWEGGVLIYLRFVRNADEIILRLLV
jgi:hypothetical protein